MTESWQIYYFRFSSAFDHSWLCTNLTTDNVTSKHLLLIFQYKHQHAKNKEYDNFWIVPCQCHNLSYSLEYHNGHFFNYNYKNWIFIRTSYLWLIVVWCVISKFNKTFFLAFQTSQLILINFWVYLWHRYLIIILWNTFDWSLFVLKSPLSVEEQSLQWNKQKLS